MRRILVFTVVVELGTGVLLAADPGIIVRLLLGGEPVGIGIVAARCFGLALLALVSACWPSRDPRTNVRAAVRGMWVYNTLIALYLIELGAVGRMAGVLLWPAAILHGLVALALAWTSRRPSPA